MIATHLQLLQHSLSLTGQQHQQIVPLRIESRRPSRPVDVRHHVLGTVQLQHPTHIGKVQATTRNVRGEEHNVRLPAKLIVDVHPPILAQRSVQRQHCDARPQFGEHLVDELDLLAAGHKDDDLGLLVLLEEGPQHRDLVLHVALDEAVIQLVRGGLCESRRLLVVGGHAFRLRETETRQVDEGFRLGGGEEQRLTVRGKVLDDRIHGSLESHVQTPVRLVQHQNAHRVAAEQRVLVHVL